MKLRWSRSAVRDLNAICDYIAAENLAAAERVGERIESAVQMLGRHPQAGRAGRVSGTRELVIAGTPYIVVYSVTAKEIHIAAVIHTARKWPDAF